MRKSVCGLIALSTMAVGCTGNKDEIPAEVPARAESSVGAGDEVRDVKKPVVELSLRQGTSETSIPLPLECVVTNVGDAPIWWDREFAVFLSFSMKTVDGKEIPPDDFATIDSAPAVAGRFVQLRPGESVSRVVDLVEGVRVFSGGRGYLRSSDGGVHHIPVGSEKIVRFPLPEGNQEFLVTAMYRGDDQTDRDALGFYFSREIAEIQFPRGPVTSNELRVSRQ